MAGALPLAADLGLSQPMEQLARSCLLTGALGERMASAPTSAGRSATSRSWAGSGATPTPTT
ncbi:MAG: hypothetical protein M3211_12560, partial [Actinomycetota bacterium]|nr:hypothetical protein [Actinomycetota bacterium]